MKILFIGDIFGKPGREIARRAIPALVATRSIDLVIANVENSAAGFGVTGDIADTILEFGVDVMTSGNHVCTNIAGCMTGQPVRFCSFDGDHTPDPRDPNQSTSWQYQVVWDWFNSF